MAGFFDVGVTARVSWSDRPRASALLVASGDPGRGFDAVVVGDYERAFGPVAEFRELVLLFEDRGVPVWMPEAGGLVTVDGPDFPALSTVLQSVIHSPAARGAGIERHRPGMGRADVAFGFDGGAVTVARFLGSRDGSRALLRHEQVHSVMAEIAGDYDSTARVEPILPGPTARSRCPVR